ncbi:MAG: FAD-binding protein [Coriobacteriia bacterium]
MENQGRDMTRRGLLKGLGALGLGIAGMTAIPGCSSKAPASAEESEWHDTADLVIVGSGTAMGAAVAALDAGKKVIILEKNDFIGGDWSINGGVIYAAAVSSIDKDVVDTRTGKADTLDACLEDWLRACDYVPDPDILKYIVKTGPELVEFFVDKGIKFSVQQTGTDPVKRGHRTPEMLGKPLTEALSKDLKERGANFMLETRGDHILLDDSGKVIGVSAVSKKDGKIKIKCPALMIAAGGITWNDEMLARYNPEAYSFCGTSGPWATGDGHTMIQEVRGALWGWHPIERVLGASVNCYITKYGTFQWPARPAYRLEQGPHSFIHVNSSGKREYNEDLYYTEIPPTTSSPLYGILDSVEFNNPGYTFLGSAKHEDLQKFIDEGKLFKADTLEDLAKQLKIDAAGLKATVEKYNAEVAAGSIEFGRPAKNALPITQPPFYGCETFPSGRCVPFSVKIDKDGTVLDLEGNRIPGLYAGGLHMIEETVLGTKYPGSGAYVASGYAASKFIAESALKYISTSKA